MSADLKMAEQNYKGQLIAYCNKLNLRVEVKEASSTGPSHDPRFTYHAFVDNKLAGVGEDKKKKNAANIAAKKALMFIQTNTQNVVMPQVAPLSEPLVHAMTPSSLCTSTEHCAVNDITSLIGQDLNYIGRFNEFCQKKGCMNSRFVDDRRGPHHIPEFFCHAVIGDRTFPEAKGKNKKEAKKNAACLALMVLKKEDPRNDLLQQIPGPNDADVLSATSTSKSSDATNSSPQESENTPSNSESSGSLISSYSTELASNFSNQDKAKEATVDAQFLQNFHDIRRLDSGGYGTVFKARKNLDQKYYVVKKVKRRSEKDISEIKALALLEHPHIVRYYHSWAGEDFFSDESCSGDSETWKKKQKCLFIQMEWCSKGTLESWIKKMEKVDRSKSLDIFQQIIDGVEYIHSKNLIHRDLKPANILFAEENIIKIADFGLVTPRSEKREFEQLIRTAGKGTELYMAPEQENETYENEVDIFALGLILIELFWKFISYRVKHEEWEKLRNANLPPAFVKQYPSEESIIKLMLSKDPKRRPSSSHLKKYFKTKSGVRLNTL